ncbi:pectinesterase inhibitor domain containing protein [Tanacetum coccineum]
MYNKVVLILFALRLLTSLVHGSTPHYSIVKSSCQTTLYPEICYSTFSTSIANNLVTKTDVIEHAINKTKDTIQANIHTINNLTAATNQTKRSKAAFHDCLELGAGILEQLDKVIQDLRAYPTNKKPLRKYADDLKTLMSTTITNTVTCLDGFSHDATCKRFRKKIRNGQDHGGKMCSNALAMITNLTDTGIANEAKYNKEETKTTVWPNWLSKKDRKLLQSGGVTPDVTVAADGSGQYTTVSAKCIVATSAARHKKPKQSNTIITASNSVASGSTTFNSATVAAVGDGFLARDITFQNTAGPSGNQAVALRVGSDLSAFYQCNIIAYQDTLYVHSNRQFFVNCYVAGTVDFTFGNAAVVFQDCQFQARRPNPNQKNMVTAQGRTDPNQNTGIVIQNVAQIRSVSMGRETCALGHVYVTTGVYKNTGAGADTSKRVNWKGWGVITSSTEAEGFTPGSFIAGGSWLSATGFPVTLGLISELIYETNQNNLNYKKSWSSIDILSHNDVSIKQLRKSILQGQDKGGKMCSNVLAMITDMTDKDIANINNNFNILNYNSKKEVTMWPEWLSAGDRKLLQTGDVTPNKTVAADDTGDYTSVADAVAAAPSKSTTRSCQLFVAALVDFILGQSLRCLTKIEMTSKPVSLVLNKRTCYPTYLGRPWKEYSRTVVMQSSISDVIVPAGWYPWDGDFALSTLYYREYQNTGPGADTSNRVTWPGWGVITNTTEAESFTAGNFIDGGNWLSSTGFPSSLGL